MGNGHWNAPHHAQSGLRAKDLFADAGNKCVTPSRRHRFFARAGGRGLHAPARPNPAPRMTRVLNHLTNAFPIWVLAGGVLALFVPQWFTWFSGP